MGTIQIHRREDGSSEEDDLYRHQGLSGNDGDDGIKMAFPEEHVLDCFSPKYGEEWAVC
jgi:hypothetical protein